MRRTMIVAATAVLVLASPAWAADEEETPAPRTGGPLMTIPVDIDDIDDLVVSDVEVEPQTDLVPGQRVRVSARLGVAMAPERTVLLLDGETEIDGDVVVSSDGSIDHVFVVPSSVQPGSHTLTLAATGLGAAELGTIEIIAAAPSLATTTTEAASPAATTTAAPAAATDDDGGSAEEASAPIGGVIPDQSRVGLSLVVGAGLLLSIVIVMLLIDRRRRKAVASFTQSATLPTATTQLPRAPQPLTESAAPTESVEAPVDAETPTSQLPAAPPPAATPVVFQLVEMRAARDSHDDQPAEEKTIGEFSELDAAKGEARRRHAANAADVDVDVDVERWWEIRAKSLGTLWMLHAWAPREYDLHGSSEPALKPEQGVS